MWGDMDMHRDTDTLYKTWPLPWKTNLFLNRS